MTIFFRPRTTLTAMSLALCLGAGVVCLPTTPFAQDASPVATVNGAAITKADLVAAEAELSQAVAQMSDAEKRDYLITFMIDMKLMAAEARERGLEKADGYDARVAFLADRVLMQNLLEQAAGAEITDEQKRTFYDEAIARAEPQEQMRARHILVETEDKAKAVLEEVRGGADFAEKAKEHSTGPSAPNGGDLGFFGKGQMVPEFEAAVVALEVGGVSEPVKTQFGWHIIKLEEKKTAEPPAFETLEGQITDLLSRQAQADLVESLRKDATIERNDPEATTSE